MEDPQYSAPMAHNGTMSAPLKAANLEDYALSIRPTSGAAEYFLTAMPFMV